jgi:hypothetical protein
MKSTKNTLITGVALMIALFTSIQMIAMQPGRKINPHLTPKEVEYTERQIKNTKLDLNEKLKQTKDSSFNVDKLQIATLKAYLNAWETIYYGDKPYNHNDFQEMINNYPDLKEAKKLFQ